MKPHDTLFRIITTDEEVQQDLIRIAIPDLAPQIQMSSVRAVPDTFTKGAQADLLLTARENNGTHHLIYILVEHKSYADRNVAVQLWGYVAAICKRWIEHEKSDRSTEHGGSRQQTLPRIHPVVLYHGNAPWEVPTRLSELHVPKKGRESTELEYRLINIVTLEPRRHRMSALSLAFFIVLKHTQKIMSREIALQVMTTLSNTKIGGPMQEVLIGYLTRQTPEENKDVLLEVTSKMLYDTEGGKRAMTMAEALFKEGQEAGLKIGQEAGLKEGQKAGLRSVARSLLREGLDQELVQRVTGLPAEQIEALAPDTDEA